MDRNDVVVILGVGCLAGGLWMVYPPAALIGIGLALVGLGVLGAWQKAKNPSPRKREKDEVR